MEENITVLIVEDDTMILEGLKYSLMQEDYEVVTAGTVKEAMDRIHGGKRFDFCLLDIMLPDGNGYEVCREIRKIR